MSSFVFFVLYFGNSRTAPPIITKMVEWQMISLRPVPPSFVCVDLLHCYSRFIYFPYLIHASFLIHSLLTTHSLRDIAIFSDSVIINWLQDWPEDFGNTGRTKNTSLDSALHKTELALAWRMQPYLIWIAAMRNSAGFKLLRSRHLANIYFS